MSKSKIKNLVFDLGGVLLRFDLPQEHLIAIKFPHLTKDEQKLLRRSVQSQSCKFKVCHCFL